MPLEDDMATKKKRASADAATEITFSAAETAAVLGVCRTTVYKMISRGELTKDAAGRIAEAELRRFLEDARARAKAIAGMTEPAKRAAAAAELQAEFAEVISEGVASSSGARPYHLPNDRGELPEPPSQIPGAERRPRKPRAGGQAEPDATAGELQAGPPPSEPEPSTKDPDAEVYV
jgi:hypothetical protein